MSVFVTGIGVITAVGNDLDENIYSLRSGITGICRSAEHDLMVARARVPDEYILDKFSLPPEDFSRTTLLALMAAKEAWGENRCTAEIRTGLISGTCVGGLDRMEQYYFRSRKEASLDIKPLMTHDNGRTTERLAKELGISGYIGTVSTACSSGANAILQGARMIEGDRLDRAIVGGSDALTIFNMKGFSSLMIYDKERCRPFDDARKGLNLGEGAGYLVLESEYSLSRTGHIPLCVLSGWNNSSDAFHQTASSPRGLGATLAMARALAKANIAAPGISYINAHGTGTDNNDLSESMALINVFGEAVPPFSSTKGFTGHTLGAAGAIEAVYCVHAICSDAVLPNLNFSTPMHETGLVPELEYRTGAPIDHALSNSFGFGGNCTCLIFSKSR